MEEGPGEDAARPAHGGAGHRRDTLTASRACLSPLPVATFCAWGVSHLYRAFHLESLENMFFRSLTKGIDQTLKHLLCL